MNPLRSAILNVVHHSTRFPAIQHAAFGSLSARRLWRLVSTLRLRLRFSAFQLSLCTERKLRSRLAKPGGVLRAEPEGRSVLTSLRSRRADKRGRKAERANYAPTCTSTAERGTGRMPRISSAARAAACSLSLMELPSPVATSRPSAETPEIKLGRCAGPCFEITR
jgi:hypothetical protein